MRSLAELELRRVERKLRFKTFNKDKERSPLYNVNNDFPSLSGKTFIDWVTDFNTKGQLSILEIGGGTHQRVARDILGKYPKSLYVGLERRAILSEIKKELEKYAGYKFIQAGMSRMHRKLADQRFNIIFAHNLAENLPNPFYVIEQVYDFLRPCGILWMNNILIYGDEWGKITQDMTSKHIVMNTAIDYTQKELLKVGIVYAHLALQRTEDSIKFPINVKESFIKNIEGYPQTTHVITYRG